MFLLNRKEKRDKKKELNILSDVITVINQYFPELISVSMGTENFDTHHERKYVMH